MIFAALFQLRLRRVGTRAADNRNLSIHRFNHAAGNIVASKTFSGDLTINGTIRATKVVGAVYV